MPPTSAVRRAGSTASTPSRQPTSRRSAAPDRRARNRFDVVLASRTRVPVGAPAYWRRTRSLCCSYPTRSPTARARRRLRDASAQLLGQSDDDALRATQEAEPVDVLVLRDLVEEF